MAVSGCRYPKKACVTKDSSQAVDKNGDSVNIAHGNPNFKERAIGLSVLGKNRLSCSAIRGNAFESWTLRVKLYFFETLLRRDGGKHGE